MLRRMSKVLARGWSQHYISGVGLPAHAEHLQKLKLPYIEIDGYDVVDYDDPNKSSKLNYLKEAKNSLLLFDNRVLFICPIICDGTGLLLNEEIIQSPRSVMINELRYHRLLSEKDVDQYKQTLIKILPSISIRQFYQNIPYETRWSNYGYNVDTQSEEPLASLIDHYLVGVC